MSGHWRARRGDRHAVPVEMRFIDMFMAALGALVFMAMLLAFLIKFLGEVPAPPPTPGTEPFRILTGSLPPARAGEPYEMAFAYRGGKGGVSWEMIGAQELPEGIQFNAAAGVLTGTPQREGAARFVLRARDGAAVMEDKAFELSIQPPLGEGWTKNYEKWVAAAMILGTLVLWVFKLLNVLGLSGSIRQLEQATAAGHTSVQVSVATGVEQTIMLPDGIEVFRQRRRSASRTAKLFVFILLIEVLFFAWRIWYA